MRLHSLRKLTLAGKLLVTDNITASYQTNISPEAISNVTNNKKMNFSVSLTSFQKAQLQSVLIFFKFVTDVYGINQLGGFIG